MLMLPSAAELASELTEWVTRIDRVSLIPHEYVEVVMVNEIGF